MAQLLVQIVRYVDDGCPAWLDCEFVDAEGCLHTLRDKVPIFTAEPIDGLTEIPRPLLVACEILAEWQDERGRQLVRITTEKPYCLESLEGLSEFVVEAKIVREAA